MLHALGAAFGLAALLAASALAFTVVKWAGAAYLSGSAFGMLRGRAATAGAGRCRSIARATPVDPVRAMRQLRR